MLACKEENDQKKVQMHVVKSLLDTVILQNLVEKENYGYGIRSDIKKTFGVSFGASTVYPRLQALEKSKYIKSKRSWNPKPKVVFEITEEGKRYLKLNELSLNIILPLVLPQNKRIIGRL